MLFIPLPVIFLIQCGNNPVSDTKSESFGFGINATKYLSFTDTSYTITINWDNYYDTLPKLQINGVDLDSGHLYATSGTFSDAGNISTFNYKIIFKGDTLEDTLTFPSSIDSFFCNGKLLRNTDVNISTVNDSIDSSANYQFTWQKPAHCTYFNLQVSSDLGEDINGYIKLENPTFTFVPTWAYLTSSYSIYSGPAINGTIFPMGDRMLNSNSSPDKIKGKLFAFYSISGPRRDFYVFIKKP
jgi:hypothetical protein